MNILFISQRVPFPPDRGDKLRSYHILEHLAKNHRIWLFCLAESKNELTYKKDLLRFCEHVEIALLRPLIKKVTSFYALFTEKPITFHCFFSEKLQKSIADFSSKTPFDLLYLYSLSSSQYVPVNFKGKIVMDFIDVDSDKWMQYAQVSRWPFKAIYARESTLIKQIEDNMVEKADISLVVTSEEQKLLKKSTKKESIEVIRNGMDFYKASGLLTGEKKEYRTLVFVGMMDYFPNVDGVCYFVKNVLPLIQKRIGAVTFYIVGANPAKRVRRLHNTKDVVVTGFIKDPTIYLSMADLCVIPLRIARGIQNKVLESLACGVLVVATECATQGIDIAEEEGLLVAQNDDLFAEKVVKLLSRPDLSYELGDKGRKAVQERYSWKEPLAKLDEIVEKLGKKSGS
ncbi:TIGR03087 family PEP-CTERM/XrtA system glycosyltransferase [Chlamydiota bacterium]